MRPPKPAKSFDPLMAPRLNFAELEGTPSFLGRRAPACEGRFQVFEGQGVVEDVGILRVAVPREGRRRTAEEYASSCQSPRSETELAQ